MPGGAGACADEAQPLVVHHVGGRGTELLVPFDDLVNRLQGGQGGRDDLRAISPLQPLAADQASRPPAI